MSGNAARKVHQPYSPILSRTEFVALHAYPFLLGLGRSDQETPERPAVTLLTRWFVLWLTYCVYITYCVLRAPHKHDQWQD